MPTKPNTNQITYDTGSNKQDLNTILDTVVPIADYTALRNYSGRATQVRITTPGIAGFFRRNGSADDNGGTVIVDGSGRSWERVFDGFVNVKWFGAVGNWDDATAAFSAAFATGRIVYAPSGVYLLNFLNVPSSTFLLGDGQTTIIKPLTPDLRCALGADSGSASSFIENIFIRDVKFLGDVGTHGFHEQRHLTSFNGVKNLLIDNCHFEGYRGDGFYLGSGNSAGQERHNLNAIIRDCVFDGVTSDNRNGITVIDGSGVRITGNTFRNCTKPGMPGPITIEPDGNAFHVINNIHIEGNTIESYGGDFGIVVYLNSGPFTSKLSGLRIIGNNISGSTFGGGSAIQVSTAEATSTTTQPMGIEVSGNTVIATQAVSKTPLVIYKVRGATIDSNTFINGGPVSIGNISAAAETAREITLRGNTFYRNGNSYGSVLIGSVDGLNFEDNTVQEPAYGTSTIGIRVMGEGVTTSSRRVKITNNDFIKGASQTLSIGVFNHTLDPATNTYNGNRDIGGSMTSEFNANNGGAELYYSGAFTPVLYDTAGGWTITQTSTGSFVRIGNLVYVSFSCSVSSISGVAGGGLAISGLPFASASSVPPRAAIGISNVDLPAGYTSVNSLVSAGASIINMRQNGDNVGEAGLSATSLKSNSTFAGTFVYQV